MPILCYWHSDGGLA